MRGIWKYTLLLPLLLHLSACAPYHSVLAGFDEVSSLRQNGIVLLLDGQAQEADRYARYGYTRKAERLQKRDAKLSDMVEASRGEFHFCPLSVQWEEQGGAPVNAYRMTIVQQPLLMGENRRDQFVLQLRDPQGRALPGGFPDEEAIGEFVAEGGLRMAFRGLSQRLLAFERRAIRAQERAALRGIQ